MYSTNPLLLIFLVWLALALLAYPVSYIWTEITYRKFKKLANKEAEVLFDKAICEFMENQKKDT